MPKFRQIDNEQTEQHVGRVLRIRRRELNMSQKVLAERMGTSQEVISNYENGVTPVRADDLPRLAHILDVLPTYFFQTGVGVEHLVLGRSEIGKIDHLLREGEDFVFPIPQYDALDDALVRHTLSDADKELALLTYYRMLGERMKTTAVRLVRELARDEREEADAVKIW